MWSNSLNASSTDPLVIAALLIRDFERGNDDVSVVVARAPW